ncbi:MAG: hypothetical protein IPM29_21080 [Planctomycetes bacterium]|nr:hypothetical protein [Planctomycetota bacterium]
MRVPRGFRAVDTARGRAVLRDDLAGVDAQLLWADGEPLGGAAGAGRGAVRLLRVGGLEIVARDLRRGGWFGRWRGGRFGSPDRALRELDVLAVLPARGVGCVQPLGALAERSPRGGWRLRLLTERLAGALPAPAFVAQRPALRRAAIDATGVLVAAAFAAGLLHPDLHAENVLLREAERDGARIVEARLVDLDRARLAAAPVPPGRRDAMLLRFERFLHKHAARLPAAFGACDRLRFLRALGFDRAGRRALVERLGPRLERQLRRRRDRYARVARRHGAH